MEAGGGGSSASDALWQPEHALVQVLSQRGKLLMRMGFMQGGRLYLHIEEAVYLIERNLLNLFIDTGNGRQLLSADAAADLMVSNGVGRDLYAVYAHLMQASLIVQRHPAQWILAPEENASGFWGAVDVPKCTRPRQHREVELTSEPQGTAALPPSILCRSVGDDQAAKDVVDENVHSQQKQRSWWPQRSECQAESPRCQVEEESAPILAPFAATPSEYEELATFPSRMVGLQVLDVLAPNSRFSRTRPDPPIYCVCISQGRPPGRDVISAVEACIGQNVPVYFANVSGADVSLYNFERATLSSIL